MHNAAFAALGLDWAYVPLPTPPERLVDAVSGLVALGFVGASVTTPHKLAVRALCETDAPSVNTLVVREHRVEASTTDAAILSAVQARSPAIIGDGGAARAFLHALPHARSYSRRAEWPPTVDDCDLVVNATSSVTGCSSPLAPGKRSSICPIRRLQLRGGAARGRRRDRRPRCPRRTRSRLVRALDGRSGAGRRDASGRRLIRVTLELHTAGEPHGPALVAIVTGLPAGSRARARSDRGDLRRRREGTAEARGRSSSRIRSSCSQGSVTGGRSARLLRSSSATAITTTGRGA